MAESSKNPAQSILTFKKCPNLKKMILHFNTDFILVAYTLCICYFTLMDYVAS